MSRALSPRGPRGSTLPRPKAFLYQSPYRPAKYQGDPEVFLLAKCFAGGLGYQGQETADFQKRVVFVGLAAFGGKAKQTHVF
jgi:hypothetical protein